MKILNCFKIVPDLDALGSEDWVADEYNNVDVSFVKTKWNCFDESALEMMLKLSDFSEGFNVSYNLHALTIGGKGCDAYLKTLYALGYQKSVRIDCKEDLRFCPGFIADLIVRYIKEQGDYQVVITGKQSADGDNGQTPFLVAELLGWPHVGQVTALEPVDDTYLKVTSSSDVGTLIQVIKTPCVLSIGNAPGSYLRVPTLKDRMRLGKQPIEIVEGSGAKQGEDTAILKLHQVNNQRSGRIIEGDNPQDKAAKLYEQYLKERL